MVHPAQLSSTCAWLNLMGIIRKRTDAVRFQTAAPQKTGYSLSNSQTEEVWRTFLFLEMEWARVQHSSTPCFIVEMAIRKPFLAKRQLTVCWEFPKRHLKDFQTTKNKSSGLIKQRLNHLAIFPISTCGGSQKLSSITLSLQSVKAA